MTPTLEELRALADEFTDRAEAAEAVVPYLPAAMAGASRASASSYRECARLLRQTLQEPK